MKLYKKIASALVLSLALVALGMVQLVHIHQLQVEEPAVTVAKKVPEMVVIQVHRHKILLLS